eukprot:s1_g1685.t1
MSFIRPEDRSARLRRAGMAAASDASLTENEVAQINAINNTSSYCRTLLFSYLALGATLFILVSGTTHEDLLRETPVKMPLFDIGVPLLTFYVVAPLLFVLFHVNLLNKLFQLRKQIEKLGTAEREIVRGRLFPFDYALLFGGFEQDQKEKVVLWAIVGSTLFVMPALLLLYTQYQFLAYHSGPITSLHSILVTFDLGALVFFHLQQDEFPNFQSTASTFGALVSWLVLVIPDSPLDQYGTRDFWDNEAQAIGLYRNLQLSGRTFWATDPPPENVAAYEAAIGFDDRTLLEARLRYGEPMDLRGRDLRHADFSNSILDFALLESANLQEADFKNASLVGAKLNLAQLQGADLGLADFQDSILGGAGLQGAALKGAQLQGADMRFAQLQGATLEFARLQGANLGHARMQGANLSFARLIGARLNQAKLQGASLAFAQIQGASFVEASLQGADLSGARSEAADYRGSQIQGANFNDAKLQLTNFTNATSVHPDKYNHRDYWIDVQQTAGRIPWGSLRREMIDRIREAWVRTPNPDFGPRTSLRERAFKSLPGTGNAFEDWPGVETSDYTSKQTDFLAELACDGSDSFASNLAFYRVDGTEGGAALARRFVSHQCESGHELKDMVSESALVFLTAIIANAERRARADPAE